MNSIDISTELQTQDNLFTADPYWVIRDWENVPTSSDYSDEYEWYRDEASFTDEELKEFLEDEGITFTEENFEDIAEAHEWKKVYYLKKHIDKGVFFTHKAAKDHLEAKKYHYSKGAYTYAHSLYSCDEVRNIRQLLLKGRVFVEKGE